MSGSWGRFEWDVHWIVWEKEIRKGCVMGRNDVFCFPHTYHFNPYLHFPFGDEVTGKKWNKNVLPFLLFPNHIYIIISWLHKFNVSSYIYLRLVFLCVKVRWPLNLCDFKISESLRSYKECKRNVWSLVGSFDLILGDRFDMKHIQEALGSLFWPVWDSKSPLGDSSRLKQPLNDPYKRQIWSKL